MISKITFPVNNGYRHEATMYAKSEIEKAAKVVDEAIQKEKEVAKKVAKEYYEQFIPKQEKTFIPMEDAIQSYAASHGRSDVITSDLGLM